jgi:hypothetical protein
MTTRVEITLPKPNHENVIVRGEYLHEDGTWQDAPPEARALAHGDQTEQYVHSKRRIVIEEVERTDG